MQRKEPLQGQRKDTKRCFVVWVVVFFGGGGGGAGENEWFVILSFDT